MLISLQFMFNSQRLTVTLIVILLVSMKYMLNSHKRTILIWLS